MSYRNAFALLLCTAMLVPTASAQTAPNADDVVKREQQRVEYLVAGKIDQLADMLSSTMSYTHSSAVLDSKEKFLASLRSGQVVYRSLKHRDVQARLATPEVAILNGESDIVVSLDGKEQNVPIRFTIVYVKRNGRWLMEAWHSTRRPAGPGA
jgi:uncharacterized protein (TIGR02246 family)